MASFREAVDEFIVDERRKNHHVVARDLERIASGTPIRKLHSVRKIYTWEKEIPRDGERGSPLLTISEPVITFEELILESEVQKELVQFMRENRETDLLASWGLAPPRLLLLCGPPGCGKTSCAEAIASELRQPLAVVRLDSVVASYLGETSNNLRRVFDFITSRPMVVLFDEIDGIGKIRTDERDHGELHRVVNSFLQLIDGYRGANVLVAATNHEHYLDPALWRRFDEVFELGLPSVSMRSQMMEQMLTRHGASKALLSSLVAKTKGMTQADLKRLAETGLRMALLAGENVVRDVHLLSALTRLTRRQKLVGQLTSPRDNLSIGGGGTRSGI